MITGQGLISRPARPSAPHAGVVLGTPVVALATGALIAFRPELAALAVTAAAIGALVVSRPAWAAYLIVLITPLVAGIDRGRLLPVLRPQEAVLLLTGGFLLARTVCTWPAGRPVRPRVDAVTGSLLAMAVANSVVVMTWMLLRGRTVTGDDLFYALVLWKYLGVYAVVRFSLRTEREFRTCLSLAVAAGAIVAVVAVLQSLQLFGVPGLLASFYAPHGNVSALDNSRGGSTLALPAATADLLIMNLAVVVGLAVRSTRTWWALPLAGLLGVGAFASGQFSSVLGLLIAVLVLAVLYRRRDLVLLLIGIGTMSAVALRPVVDKRLSGFGGVDGLPESWRGRLSNLEYFWQTLFADWNWVLGVRPSAKLPGPRALGIDWVWIESGYTWLLWGGGLPLLAGFLVFAFAAGRRSWADARRTPGAAGAAAGAVATAVVVMVVLMLFDPHLTYRGSAELFFALLGVSAAGRAAGPSPQRTSSREVDHAV